MHRAHGFTLIELLVVISIIAIATAGVTLALRDSGQTKLEREAVRLAALLESARAQSRMRGVAVRWVPSAHGFTFEGLPKGVLPEGWLEADSVLLTAKPLELGPEPIITRQSITLQTPANGTTPQGATTLFIATDGLAPFTVQTP